jgi:hypothetical protein
MKSMGLLQDESEGRESQRLSKWFASRLDAREVVRNNFRKVTNVRSTPQDEVVLCIPTMGERARPCGVDTRAEWVQVPNPA